MSGTEAVNLSELDMTNFETLLQQEFQCSEPVECTIRLSEIVKLQRPDDPRVQRSPFILVFHAPKSVPPVQGTYQLSNANFGQFSVFMVPVSETEEKLVLEATFT